MHVELCSTIENDLSATLTAFDSNPDITGICVLAAADESMQPATIDETLRGLSTPVFGGLFPKILHNGEAHDTGAIVAGFTTQVDVRTVSSTEQGEASAASTEDMTASETAFVFLDAHADDGETLVQQLHDTYGVGCNYMGGGAGTLGGSQQRCLFTNDGLVGEAVVIAMVEAESSIGVEHGWTDIGGPFEITAASGRRLETLDGSPASDRYAEIIEAETDRTVTPENFLDVATSYPFGISRLGAERIVRDPFEVNSDGSLTCFGELPEGEFVHILTGNPDKLVAAAERAQKNAMEASTADSTLFVFDCISRAQYLGPEFSRELAALSQEPATIGALTIGEIANSGAGHLDYYNKTAVVCALTATVSEGKLHD